MKHVNVNVDQIQLFVIINKDRIMINVEVNVKNQLIKVYVIKDMLRVLVNPSNCECECDKSCDIGECIQIMKIANVEKGWLINQFMNVLKLLINKQKQLPKVNINVILAYCTLYYFQYSLQLMLELLLILFAINM